MSKLLEKLIKNSPTKHTSVLSESVMFKDKDIIPTEIPIVNLAFSGELDGGISSGLTLLAGPSKVFKTNLALVCVKAFMDKYEDGVCILYDSEGGATPDYLNSLGVDSNRVIHVPIEHIEMLKFDIVKQLKEIDRTDKVIIVIDSIGNTASLKELEDAMNEKSVAEMQRAKSIKGLFRMITPSLVSKDVPCIAICHTYQEMGLYPKQIISGGLGLIYSANQAFIIGKAQDKDGNELSGFNFTLNVEKSRFVREKSKFTFSVNFDKGINNWSGILDLALESGDCVKPNMGWYQLVDNETGELIGNKVRAKDTECGEFLGVIMKRRAFHEFVSKKFKLATGTLLKDEDIEKEFDDVEDENDE
jgi:RecA/RadA recombinase